MKILDKWGVLLAAVMGALIYFFGGLNYLALMFSFLFFGVAVTKYEHEIKKEMGIYEHERGWENVLSNGLVPTLLAIASPSIGPIPFIASLAATTSDTFASEIGVLGKGKPISLENLKEVKPGTSGAMSAMGTVASMLGAAAIGIVAIFLFGINPAVALLVTLAGFVGSFADTLLGILEEKGIGTKGTTNFFCSVTGGLIGLFI
ncbi:DUF92 domain-containing protein [Candidatus Micrarchaeota archaeon]|nr:DUF92 domain-containing protein [Candidatus Micrarchaeota archaeon]